MAPVHSIFYNSGSRVSGCSSLMSNMALYNASSIFEAERWKCASLFSMYFSLRIVYSVRIGICLLAGILPTFLRVCLRVNLLFNVLYFFINNYRTNPVVKKFPVFVHDPISTFSDPV